MTPSEPASPCIGVCRIDAAERCEGCGRSLDEIAEWPTASPARKLQILRRLRSPRSRLDNQFSSLRA